MVKLLKTKRSRKDELLAPSKTKEIKKKVYLDDSRAHRFKKKTTEMNNLSAIVAEKFQSLNIMPYSYSADNIGSYLLDEIQSLNTFEKTHEWFILHKRLEPLTFNLSLIILNKDKIVDNLLKDFKERPVNKIAVLKLLFQLVRDLKDECYQLVMDKCIEMIIDCINDEELRFIEHGVALLAAFLKFSNKSIKSNYPSFISKVVNLLFSKSLSKKTLKAISEALTYTFKKAGSLEIKHSLFSTMIETISDILEKHNSLSTTHRMAYFLSCYLFESTKNFKNVLDYQVKQSFDIFFRSLEKESGNENLVLCGNMVLRILTYKFSKLEYKYNKEPKDRDEIYIEDLISYLIEGVTKEYRNMVDGLSEALCELCLYQDGLLITDKIIEPIRSFVDANIANEKILTLVAVLVLKKSYWNYCFIQDICSSKANSEIFFKLLHEIYLQKGLKSLELSSVRGKTKPRVQKLGFEKITAPIVHSFISVLLDILSANYIFDDHMSFIASLSISASFFSSIYANRRIKPKSDTICQNLLDFIKRSYKGLLDNINEAPKQLEFYMLLKFIIILDIDNISRQFKVEIESMLETLYSLHTCVESAPEVRSLYKAGGKEINIGYLECLGYITQQNPGLLFDYNIAALSELYVATSGTSSNDDIVYMRRFSIIFKANYNDNIILKSLMTICNTLSTKNIDISGILAEFYDYFVSNLGNRNINIVRLSLKFISKFASVDEISKDARFLKEKSLTSYLDEVK